MKVPSSVLIRNLLPHHRFRVTRADQGDCRGPQSRNLLLIAVRLHPSESENDSKKKCSTDTSPTWVHITTSTPS